MYKCWDKIPEGCVVTGVHEHLTDQSPKDVIIKVNSVLNS